MIAIVGSGISGLMLSYFLLQSDKYENITIFESAKPGGSVQTEKINDSILDIGSYGIFADHPLLLSLCKEIGIDSELVRSTKDFDQNFIPKDKYLVKAPPSIQKINKSSILFIGEKLKASKAFKQNFPIWDSMPLYEAFKTIFGQTSADYFASVIARSLFFKEAEDIEVSSAFPEIYELIKEGKNLRASLDESEKARKEYWDQQNFKPEYLKNFTPGFYSFQNGMNSLIKALQDHLKEKKVHLENIRIAKVNKIKTDYYLYSKNSRYGPYQKIIFTISPQELSKFFRDLDKEMSIQFNEKKPAFVTEVFHGWSTKTFQTRGHGVFCPRISKIPFLATIFISNLFPNRSPKDVFLTKTYLSGDGEFFDDQDLIRINLDSLKRLFKIKEDPLWSQVYRSPVGFADHSIGYYAWKKSILEKIEKHPGLYLHGNYFQSFRVHELIDSCYKFVQEKL